jgi:hypothetical protein
MPEVRLCARLDTVTTRDGPEAINSGKSNCVSKKCPKWLMPKAISKPSAVKPRKPATPALLMSKFKGKCMALNCSAQARTEDKLAKSSGKNKASGPSASDRIWSITGCVRESERPAMTTW